MALNPLNSNNLELLAKGLKNNCRLNYFTTVHCHWLQIDIHLSCCLFLVTSESPDHFVCCHSLQVSQSDENVELQRLDEACYKSFLKLAYHSRACSGI